MAGMKLSTLEFIRLLPAFMRDDAAVRGLAAGLDEIIPGWLKALAASPHGTGSTSCPRTSWTIWPGSSIFCGMTNPSGIDAKREIIKNSDEVYRHLAPSGRWRMS